MRLLCAALLVASAGAAAARGAPLPIANGSFEDPPTAPGSFDTDAPAPPGWNAHGAIDFGFRTVGVLNPATTTLYADPVPDGANVGVVFLLDDPGDQSAFAGSEAGLEQTLAGVPLETQTTYTLTVEVGNLADDAEPPHAAFQFGGFPGYRVELLAGGEVVASDDDTLDPEEGRFVTASVELTVGASHALAGEDLGIRLVNRNAAAGLEVNFDHVRLDAVPAPEPAGALQLAAGAAALALRAALRARARGRA